MNNTHLIRDIFGIFNTGDSNHSRTTADGLYTITPIGQLINVKIQKVVDN